MAAAGSGSRGQTPSDDPSLSLCLPVRFSHVLCRKTHAQSRLRITINARPSRTLDRNKKLFERRASNTARSCISHHAWFYRAHTSLLSSILYSLPARVCIRNTDTVEPADAHAQTRTQSRAHADTKPTPWVRLFVSTLKRVFYLA